MITKINKEGKDLITKWEGLRLKPYLCSAGVATIGYGSTRYENGKGVKLTDPQITKERANELFELTIDKYEKAVFTLGPDELTQNQFNALVSFAYNLGVTALANSTLMRKVNANLNDPTIAAEFRKWVNAGGKKVEGLVNRREDEIKMYFK